jgi:hypothetical protein
MDRQIFRRQQNLPSNFLLQADQWTMEAIGLFMADVLGSSTAVARLPCAPTSPMSLAVKVGPGSIYSLQSLEASPIGERLDGTGGLVADTATDHKIVKQGLLRDTQTFSLPVPPTTGQSMVYLIEAQFQEADDAGVDLQFYNTVNPNASIVEHLSPARRDICALQLKAGTAATAGTQTQPTTDAGWVPVWAITVNHSDTSIGSGAIAAAAGSPFVSIGGGGGGGTVTNWTTVNANYTASNGDKLIGDVSGGTFTVKLPAAPVSDSTTVRIKGNFATTNLTVDPNGHQFDFGVAGLSSTLVLNKDSIDMLAVFDGTHWRI